MTNPINPFQEEYNRTIPDKIKLIQTLIDNMFTTMNEENLMALRNVVHKFAGSAGMYGYSSVSAICKEFDQKLIEKKSHIEELKNNPNWKKEVELYFTKIKQGFEYVC